MRGASSSLQSILGFRIDGLGKQKGDLAGSLVICAEQFADEADLLGHRLIFVVNCVCACTCVCMCTSTHAHNKFQVVIARLNPKP